MAGLFSEAAHAAAAKDVKFAMTVGKGLSVGNLDIVPGLDLTTRLGITMNRSVIFATIDVLRASGDADGDSASGSLLTLGLGGRYFLRAQEAGSLSPYGAVELFTVLPSTDVDDEADDVVADVKSFGMLGGFGGEYFVNDSVTVGAEIGLMRYAASYDEDDYEVKGALLNTYSAILLNFYM